MRKNGFTITEALIAIFIFSIVSVAIYSSLSQLMEYSETIRNKAEIGQEVDIAFSTLMQDISSMSIVMTPQKNVVPLKVTDSNGNTSFTNQTLKFSDSINYKGQTISFTTSEHPKWEDDNNDGDRDPDELKIGTLASSKYDVDFQSESDIPMDGISFSIGLSDTDYNAGVNGDSSIRNHYFLYYRDDDGDGQVFVDGEPEDPERDGIDDDGDGLDGEDPAVEGGVVGYRVSYFTVEMNDSWFELGGHRYKKYKLIRREYKPHTGGERFRVLADNIVVFSVLPFKVVKDQRIYLSPDTLHLEYDSDEGEYNYSRLNNFNLNFEIVIIAVTNPGSLIKFKRVFTPVLFHVSGG